MVTSEFDPDRQIGRIVLRPNRSWSWRANVYLLCSLMLISGVIGLVYALLGYWPILPITALELAVLGGCLYYCVRRTHRQEVLTFSPEHLTIEKGIRAPTESHRYERFWTRIEIDAPAHPWYEPRFAVRSRGAEIEIGAFLGRTDKGLLATELRRMVNQY
jgi:uncharacterized membrane protein